MGLFFSHATQLQALFLMEQASHRQMLTLAAEGRGGLRTIAAETTVCFPLCYRGATNRSTRPSPTPMLLHWPAVLGASFHSGRLWPSPILRDCFRENIQRQRESG